MLTSFALIFVCGVIMKVIMEKLNLPGLIGYMLVGLVLGPQLLNVIDSSVLDMSADLRQVALIIILTRAGLSLDINTLKKVGRQSICLSFVPASFEILGVIIISTFLFSMNIAEAGVLGAVLAAVSPAVVVPRMLKLMKEGYGSDKGIPQMVMAGSSVDDIFVIVMFTAFTGIVQNGEFSLLSFLGVPVSIVLGILVGLLVGKVFAYVNKVMNLSGVYSVLFLISISFLLLQLQTQIEAWIPFSGLIAIMATGLGLRQNNIEVSTSCEHIYTKLWNAAEILLFVFVGCAVQFQSIESVGILALVIIAFGLVFRMVGVFISVFGNALETKEKLFVGIAYMPKATVQAAIGAVPLSMGLPFGAEILAVAAIAILVTAPVGAVLIDNTYKKLLHKNA